MFNPMAHVGFWYSSSLNCSVLLRLVNDVVVQAVGGIDVEALPRLAHDVIAEAVGGIGVEAIP